MRQKIESKVNELQVIAGRTAISYATTNNPDDRLLFKSMEYAIGILIGLLNEDTDIIQPPNPPIKLVKSDEKNEPKK